MGHLENGTWIELSLAERSRGGAFERPDTEWRNWITPDGAPGPTGDGGFPAEAGRYHLYVSHACPWAHRTLIFRKLKSLEALIDVSVVHPDMLADGWTFAEDFDGATGDRLHGARFLREVYTRADPGASGHVTVPVLWDRVRETIVSNESADIIRMFNAAFDGLTGNTEDYYPDDLRSEIDAVNARVYDTVNNGVYRAGFATSQAAYDKAAAELFDSLDWLEARLAAQRYLAGNRVTEADWRLATTLFRFDPVYHTHFKCNRNFLREMPHLWAYARELYQWPVPEGRVADTVHFDHIVRHYHYSHDSVNPYRIIPVNPVLDWDAPHGRDV